MSQHELTQNETQLLLESINSDTKTVSIRLQEGEHQYTLAKELTSFQLELRFPDIKELIGKAYGEQKVDDQRLIRNIQTILKKMERNNIVRILPKKRPWELQRYALSSFKFEDVDKNRITLATPPQIEQMQNRLHSLPNLENFASAKPSHTKIKTWTLMLLMILAYTAVIWAFTQPTINLIVLIPALYISVACSLILGKLLSQK